jgi:hypothetical protein
MPYEVAVGIIPTKTVSPSALGGTASLILTVPLLNELKNLSQEEATTKAFVEGLEVSKTSIPELVAEAVQNGFLVSKYQQVQFR